MLGGTKAFMKASAKYLPILGKYSNVFLNEVSQRYFFTFYLMDILIPFFSQNLQGWCWWFCEFIWLKRNWNTDKQKIDSGLRQVIKYFF